MKQSINRRPIADTGNVLLVTLSTILVLSLIGATIVRNCTARYNQTAKQVDAWKAALTAAEAGGDVAYATIRKAVNTASPTTVFSADGWTQTSTTPPVWTKSVPAFGPSGSLTATVTVDTLPSTSINPPDTNYYYRIRSTGTAHVYGLQRTALDDRLSTGNRFVQDSNTRGDGDTLLRKIDFNYDHFKATYGDGDGNGKQIVAVAYPQISRRVELIAVPVRLFEVAIKAGGTFYGLGSAAYIDSFRSSNGAYNSSVKTNPSDPHFVDSRSGSVQINSGVATIMGDIYGNVYTNNGTVTGHTSNIVSPGVIDNSVPFDQNSYSMPDTTGWISRSTPSSVSSNVSITPAAAGTAASPNYYIFSSWANNGDLTVNPTVVGGVPQETYVSIRVNDDIGTSTGQGPHITANAHVHMQIYYTGNFQTKAGYINNNTGFSGNLQFINISSSPTTIDINSPGDFSAVFYAPNADMNINGNPDITGAVVVHNFYSNGNVGWHYDRDLYSEGSPADYRVASYVEDVR